LNTGERSEPGRRLSEATETTEKNLQATTNPEGGRCKWKKVSSQSVCRFVSLRNQSHSWLLESLDLLARHRSMSPPEKPRRLSEEDPASALEENRVPWDKIVGQGADDVRQHENEEVSQELTHV
jgi:hypothetical protein